MRFVPHAIAHNLDKRKQFNDLYLSIGEMWYEHYEAIKDKEFIKKNVSQNVKVIGCFEEMIPSQNMESLLSDTLLLPISDNIWNQKTFYNKLVPNSTYILSIENPHFILGEGTQYSFVIKNRDTGHVPVIQKLPIIKNRHILFSTSSDPTNLDMRIYSGIAGEANNKSLKIDKITLKKL